MAKLIIALSLALFLAGCKSSGSEPVTEPVQQIAPLPPLPAVEMPAYEFIQGSGRPVVILMAGGMHDSLYGRLMGNVPSDLIGAGFSLLALDLPCHGAETGGLSCWRNRLASGDADLFRSYCANLSRVLDEIGHAEVSAIGQSRGGYMAVTCAAYDSRIRNIALLAPVTDLELLTEFDSYAVPAAFDLSQYVPFISDRNFLVRITEDDDRVGTDSAVAFAELVDALLQLLPGDRHVPVEDGTTTQWLLDWTK